ncbi:MAG: DNA adenine methylase [Candidatus Cloacimonadia bacterium]
MNYIGSKFNIMDFISKSIFKVVGTDFELFCDLFSGTGSVGIHFKEKGHKVISNDFQYYSYVLSRHYIGNNRPLKFEGLVDKLEVNNRLYHDAYERVCSHLNSLPGIEGFIYNNYCWGGTHNSKYPRRYFSDHNGKKSDHIRITIEEWKSQDLINNDEYFYLLATLIESLDKYANTASVYGAFLKKLKKTAQKEMKLQYLPLYKSHKENEVYNLDCNKLITLIEGDVLYMDPPYNHRQYAANYHVLETVAKYDNPVLYGVTGLRDYTRQKSLFGYKNKALDQLETLVSKAKFNYIFLSYNNEGIMSTSDIENIMSKYGKYGVFIQKNGRFKADKNENRKYKSDHTFEYVHYIKKH